MTGPAKPDTAAIAAFFEAAKKANPAAVRGDSYRIRGIGSTPDTMSRILAHVLKGEKRGTFSLPWLLEKNPEATPRLGEYVVLVDFDGKPGALVTTTELENITYDTITAAHTAIDGPAIRALDKWQAIHKPYWTSALAAIGRQFAGDLPVIVEHFKLVYPQTDPAGATIRGIDALPPGPAKPTVAALDAFWRALRIARRDLTLPDSFEVRCIGISAETVERIFTYIATGTKRGTFQLPPLMKAKGQEPAKVGDVAVLTDYSGAPRMAVRITAIETTTFGEIGPQHTALDGPPVQDVKVWKPMHREFWSKDCARFGIAFSDALPVTIERFEVIYPPSLDKPVPAALQS